MKPQSEGGVLPDSTIVRVAAGAGWVLFGLALAVLAGWAFQMPSLVSIVPGLATMKANTALAFLLAGVALVRRNSRDFLLYSLAVLLIGAATLAEYLSNSEFGIDQLLFRDPQSAIDPGRMSQITAFALVILGLGLLLMNAQSAWARRLSRSLGLLTGIIGFVAVLGYCYDTRALYQVRPYASVALHTAVGLVIAALGLQCVHPQEGIVQQVHTNTAGGAMLRQLLPAALLIPFLLGFAAWLGHKYLGWALGFSMALVIAATTFCLLAVMLRNAGRLEEKDVALREMNRTLEERVRQRTAELDAQMRERGRIQEILDGQRAQMIAASKLTSLGEMAGGLAHEINSPLNIIQARASDLQETADTSEVVDSGTVVKATASILRTSERIMRVVRGLRVFARDGRADPFEDVPLQAILDDTLSLCRERFADRGIQLEVSGLERHLTLECQRVQVSQVLLNLLNNAFDAVQLLPNRWVRVAVSEENDHVSIAVTDSGRGIPKEIAEKAMQPFFTTKPVGKGTGLGLSISKGIAEAHNGQLWIDYRSSNTRIVLSLPKHHTPAGKCDHEPPVQQEAVVR